MVEISRNARAILQKFTEDNVDTKTFQEYGRSAFWLWFDKIISLVYSLDNDEAPYIPGQISEMKYWGLIYYDKTIVNGEIIVVVTGFKIDPYNFWNQLNHAPLNDTLFTPKFNTPEAWVNQERQTHPFLGKLPICKPLGMRGIYKLQTSSGKWYVCDKHLNPIGNKYLYDDIKRFQRHKDGTYAIGIIHNQSWKIGTNGLIIQPNTNISTDSKGNYVAANGDGADYVSESKHSKLDIIIAETIGRFLKRELLA